MQSSWGKNIVYSLFGESHGPMIGITIHHLPAGIKLDLEAIQFDLDRRRPGKSKYTTARQEKDEFEIVSGYFNEHTTGAPLTAIIRNTDQRSKDYSKVRSKMRPSHADYAAYVKYKGFNDYRGGGHFSGRLTAPIVFAGAVAKQLLEDKGFVIAARITQIGHVKDLPLEKVNVETINTFKGQTFPLYDSTKTDLMKKEIENAKMDCDSVGGSIEVFALNVPAGIGEPFFNSVESTLSQLFYSIPAVKAVTFGNGLDIISMRGSEANDELHYEGDDVKAFTNNNGGITGGITNGMPVIAKLNIKPTPTLGKKQRMVDVESKTDIVDLIEGRHDPCIIPRAIPVAESMMAMGLLELYLDYQWSKRWCKDD